MKRLSIAELKAQKGAIANTSIYTGGTEQDCHIIRRPADASTIRG